MAHSRWLTIACASCMGSLATAADTTSTSPAQADEQQALEEIIITGSRVAISGDAAPTPVTIIAQEQLQLAAPTSLADGLAQIPEFRGSSRPSTFITPQGSTGAFLNLRGLGQNRVLTLWNGRRITPTTISERVDINTLPDLLIQRTDIVTGGASAAYGSDAVAGVVNLVLDEKFEGVRGDFGAGVSSRSDNESLKARMALGTAVMGGRGHFLGSIDYFKSDGVLNTDKRDWDLKHCNVIPNPTFATDGRTANLWRCGVTGVFTTGGMINSGPLRGTQFLPGGATAPFAYGTEVSNNVMVGGSGYWNPRGNIATPITSKNAFARFGFDATDDLRLFVEGSYSQSDSYFYGTSPSYVGTTAASTTNAITGLTTTNGITIYNDNAFLPAAVRTQMAGSNITSFVLNRISPDWGRNEGISDTTTYRGAVGLNWSLGAWDVDWALDSGRTHARLENNHSPNQIKLFEALDSVINPATGQAVCRSMLNTANAGRGCVPLNPFGTGSASPAAIQYVFGDSGYSDIYLTQISSEANLRGSPFSTWAGETAFATGIAWRRFSAEQISDPLSQTYISQVAGSRGMPTGLNNKLGVFLTGNQNFQPEKTISVKEVYAELQAPLAKDLPFLHAADANVAFRHADYSTTGGVNAWKAGGSIAPIESIRLRFTRSRDVRAPNINELYQPALVSLATINDPATGSSSNVPVYNGGNENLVPEIANTVTAGIVLRPSFLPELSVAIDYYKIKIGNSIGNVAAANNIVQWCYQGFAVYCQLVNRLSNGTLASVNTYSVNQNLVENSGIDAEVNYRATIGSLKLGVRVLASYLNTLATTDPFGSTTDAAGVNGGEAAGTPEWQGSLGVTLGYRNLTTFVQQRYIGSGLYSNVYVLGGRTSNSLDYNHVDGRTYTDLTLRYDFSAANADWQVYGTVNNLFDKDPPPSPTRVGLPASILGTNPTLYDVIGRQYNLGVRFKF